MANVLVLTSDIPFFPGKNGHDFFNLRHLACTHHIGVIGPHHGWFPAEGMQNLRKAVGSVYLWPEPVEPTAYCPIETFHGVLNDLVGRAPAGIRNAAWQQLLDLSGKAKEACNNLAMLANCAPHILRALSDRHWHAIVLIQTNLTAALDYLPTNLGRIVYFHDIRSDYLSRNPQVAPSKRELQAISEEEQRAVSECDAVGFVSDLDLDRAIRILDVSTQVGVCPIPVDTEYFTPPPPTWKKPSHPVVLFTGHLSHPPNINAVLWFLAEIWPLVAEADSQVVFAVGGLLPDPRVSEACAAAPRCELHTNVPDIRPLFWNADAYVVPMRFGGGVRQKIFEAWSMEVPVVCTSMAAEGTPAVSGKNCLMADSPEALAGHILHLLRNRESNRSIAVDANRTVHRTNSIEAAAPRFQELVERTIRIRQARPHKVLFDLRWMEIGRAGGTEQMSHELIDAIARHDQRNQYRIYCPRQSQCEWLFPDGFRHRFIDSDKLYNRVRGLRAAVGNQLALQLGEDGFMNGAMQTLKFYRKLDFDVVHSLCSYIHPDLAAFPNVLTMLDIQHVWYPENFTPENWKERDTLYRESCMSAAHIITISEFTRQDLHEKYGIALDRMTTVWIIPSKLSWVRPTKALQERTLARLGIRGRFLFFPGHSWPHKNHVGLIEAFDMIRDELPGDILLVLTGNPFPEDHPAAIMVRDRGLGRRVHHLGFRSPREMQVLFNTAHAMVFPSYFEGFGMPVAEALIAGCPVACSNITSLPEIGGDAVTYFDPRHSREIAARALQLCTDDSFRESLIAAGMKRRLQFSSRQAAVKTLAVHRRVFDETYN